jgi:hypothetical protein
MEPDANVPFAYVHICISKDFLHGWHKKANARNRKMLWKTLTYFILPIFTPHFILPDFPAISFVYGINVR